MVFNNIQHLLRVLLKFYLPQGISIFYFGLVDVAFFLGNLGGV